MSTIWRIPSDKYFEPGRHPRLSDNILSNDRCTLIVVLSSHIEITLATNHNKPHQGWIILKV